MTLDQIDPGYSSAMNNLTEVSVILIGQPWTQTMMMHLTKG